MEKSRNAAHLKDVIERVKDITASFADADLPDYARDRLSEELVLHRRTLELAFEDRREHGPEMSVADSDAYFAEKLSGMIEFAKMAVKPEIREGYDSEKIKENVDHFAYLVSGLVAADWP